MDMMMDEVITSAAQAARTGDFATARTALGLGPDAPSDDALTQAASGLERALSLHSQKRYDEALPLLAQADDALQTSSNELLRLTVRLVGGLERGMLAAAVGDRNVAKQILRDAAVAAETGSVTYPQLAPLANQLSALSSQIDAGAALEADELGDADVAIRSALDRYRQNIELPPWDEDDRRWREIDFRRMTVLLRSLHAYRAISGGKLREAEAALAETSDEAAELEHLVGEAPVPRPKAAEIRAILALRTAVSGLYLLWLAEDAGERSFPADRIPAVDSGELGKAILALREDGAQAGSEGDVFVEFARAIDDQRQRLGERKIRRDEPVPADELTGSQRLISLGTVAIIAVIGIVVVGGTGIRENALIALIAFAIIAILAFVPLLLAILGYERTKTLIPVLIPFIEAFTKLIGVAQPKPEEQDDVEGDDADGEDEPGNGEPAEGVPPAMEPGTAAQDAPRPNAAEGGQAPRANQEREG